MITQGKLALCLLAMLALLGLAPAAGAQAVDLTGTYTGSMNAMAQSGFIPNVPIKMVVTDQQTDPDPAKNIVYFRGFFTASRPFGFGVPTPITGTVEGGTDAHLTGDTYFS